MDTIALDTTRFIAGGPPRLLIRSRNATYAPVKRTCGRYDACGGFTTGERAGNGARIAHLRTSVRRAINTVIAH